ncbi:transducin/WD40 repeat-like superfamily protein [Artemisia annua]|uniref:Transducin/WD40 repeat-like superfamily protein n=1 Tax=Artemisia annua TaxID=35608 RepID=A0A2U1PG07_ARTAN|nr:transducin/WD40 repeat-like superfamily protein [Artemisia annua]
MRKEKCYIHINLQNYINTFIRQPIVEAILKGRMGAIRTIKFSSDGRYLDIAEPADFVHIFDSQTDYGSGQEIDVFGEIGGISFSPDAEALFVGILDRTYGSYGSVLENNRRHHNRYLEVIF